MLESVILAPHAVKRLIEPDEVAATIAFLAGPERRGVHRRTRDDGPRMDRPVDLSNRLVELLEHAVRASEPEVALHALSALRRELDAFERVQAWRALDAGSSYGAVARALGISRQAAHRRYRELAAATEPPDGAAEPARLRVAPEARAAVQLASEEAAALGAPRMGSEHLLLGILRAGDPIASAALRAGGITLETARMAAQPTLAGEEPPDDRASQVTMYARKVFTTRCGRRRRSRAT